MEEKAKIIANVRAQRAAVARLFQRRKEREEKRKEKEEKRTTFSRKSKENKVDSEVTELKQRLEKIQRKKPVAIHTSRQKDATLDPPLWEKIDLECIRKEKAKKWSFFSRSDSCCQEKKSRVHSGTIVNLNFIFPLTNQTELR
ncbi:hypothetical protein SAY87_031728 [Trapa incisa]|uniref:Uncharacterized protein n=1 Tax=Trapa incisa TaxID=236973 RepID=A0AAN7QM08_9MYRT|nr:hypothetical protein SAY87_031728 [Trapa incisa]